MQSLQTLVIHSAQAFTATDSTLVNVENILTVDDISTADRKYDFTDGVGKDLFIYHPSTKAYLSTRHHVKGIRNRNHKREKCSEETISKEPSTTCRPSNSLHGFQRRTFS